MPRKIIYLINPVSGTKKKQQVTELIRERTNEAGISFEILPSSSEGNYSGLRQRIERESITDVVICGGDGTVNGVVQALQGTRVNIGIIPMGSGNGLAFTVKIPADPAQALDVIFKGNAQLTDAFQINNRFSCMLCGIGFDAQVAHEFAKQKSRGLKTYIKVSTLQFLKCKPYPFEIVVKGETMKTDAFFISIANSNQFGNNVTIAPQASLSDGLLDIVVVKKMNKLQLPFSILLQLLGNNAPNYKVDHDTKNITYLQTEEILIRNPTLAPLHIDGDPADTANEFNIRIIKNCFHFIQP